MRKRILLIQGHPDLSERHLCHALEDAYANAATAAGYEIRRIHVGAIDFPLLKSQSDWEKGAVPANLVQAQADIKWSEHMVLFFPLWLGDMPALLKGFLEQVARPGFAFNGDAKNPLVKKGLTGRSARIVVTMGMPALLYRWYFRAHSIKSLERNILGFVGIAPISKTLIGLVGNMQPAAATKWLKEMGELGTRGS